MRRLAAGWAGWLLVAVVGCGPEAPDAASFFSGECRLDRTAAEPCASCLHLDLVVTLGAENDAGFLTDGGTLGDIVRDDSGNYWVGQRDQIKLFDSTGAFVSAVGRAGRGPMEFAFAQPMHTDSLGRVHVFDNRNAKVSVIGPDRTLHEERKLPATAVMAMTPVADGSRYAIQAWIPDSERIGLPIHIVNGGEIVKSFGVGREPEQEVEGINSFTAQRRLTTGPHGGIFSSHYYDYIVEAWSEDGLQAGRMEGPLLHDGPRTPGPWTWDNPPWNEIYDIMVDSSYRLWIVFRYRRPDWRDNMVELIGSRGQVALAPADGRLSSYYHSRIDVVDLQTCTTVASRWHVGVLMTFVEEGMVSEVAYDDVRGEIVNIWRLTYTRKGRPTAEGESTMPIIARIGQIQGGPYVPTLRDPRPRSDTARAGDDQPQP